VFRPLPSTKNGPPGMYATPCATASLTRAAVSRFVVQREEGEEAAVGGVHARVRKCFERLDHHAALAAIERAHALDLRRELAAGHELVDDRLVEHARAEIGGLLGDLERSSSGLRPTIQPQRSPARGLSRTIRGR
jgi:hypothetical protein